MRVVPHKKYSDRYVDASYYVFSQLHSILGVALNKSLFLPFLRRGAACLKGHTDESAHLYRLIVLTAQVRSNSRSLVVKRERNHYLLSATLCSLSE